MDLKLLQLLIGERLRSLGLTETEFSRAVAGHGTVVTDIRRGRKPGAERLEKICEVLGLEFYVGLPRGDHESVVPSVIAEALDLPAGVDVAIRTPAMTGRTADADSPPSVPSLTLPDLSVFSPKTDMPVRGWAKCSIEGYLEDETKDHLDAPAPLHLPDEAAFYALALGPSMRPEGIDNGDYCLVSPAEPLQAGWRVWLLNRQRKATIKRLVDVTETRYRLLGWRDPNRRGRQAPYDDEWMRSNVAAEGVVLVVYRGAPSRTHPPELIPDPKPPGEDPSRVDAGARASGAEQDRVLDELVRELRALREEQAALRELVAHLASGTPARPAKRKRR